MAVSVALILVVILVPFIGVVNGKKEELEGCDLYNGRWLYDSSYPLYNSSQCSFIEFEFDCQQNGRPDDLYLKYRWKPNSCDLPRFSARKFLEKYRNKRIIFVGDSISLNQWQSLTCMLHSRSPHSEYLLERVQGVSTFTFLKQNVSLILSRNALLVDIAHKSWGRVLKLNAIADNDAELWQGSHVLVFNSWHWWLHRGRKQPWDFVTDGDRLYKDMDRLVAYEKALLTWAQWVNENIDFTKTKVFFQGISPTHMNAKFWGNYDGDSCGEETRPVFGPPHPRKRLPAQVILERVIGSMSKRVHLLNITRLSQHRKDAHPSVYGIPGRHIGMDCSHWCLPGVPDAWNELLIAELTSG
ncbi:protein trichome birefringence-like 41 isoform X1 [Neltuma alba]|uniref:protein trichome birefringence-like 41 isoform X1 n=1 Tax=Neltuma alba TaxID=207710 RepID=UPI0010A46B03|nr:protein trichome birefringence-like 41 isoform X1 [Prosopis alba]